MSRKLERIQDWLLPILQNHPPTSKPFILALSGIQGSGKSTIVQHIQQDLSARGYKTAQLSLDDLYLTFPEQSELSKGGNTLWASRGQFGTHDITLGKSVFEQLSNRGEGIVSIPFYDKSQFDGRGDRAPESLWAQVDVPLDVIIFEGWGVGFQAISDEQFPSALAQFDEHSQVARHSTETLRQVNDVLRMYTESFMGRDFFDAIVLLQALDTQFVYNWRLQQEHAMWKVKGKGMTDNQVEAFIDRYYTSYELYLPRLISGMFSEEKPGHQLNLQMDKDRNLVGSRII